MHVRKIVFGLLSILLGVPHLTAQTSLIGTWKEGDRFSYVLEDKYSNFYDSAKLNQKLTLDTNWHVKSVGVDGSALVEVKIEQVRFNADQKGVPAGWEQFSFDSQNPIEPRNKGEMSTFGALNAFVGSQMSITINEKRELSKFLLSEPLAEHLERNQITLELAGFYGHTFTTNGMQRRMTSWLIASPPKPVSKGETWCHDQISRYEDLFLGVDTYTLEGPALWSGQTLSKISVKSEFKVPDNDTGKQEPKISEQSGEGVVYIDERTGRIVDATLRYHVAQQSAFGKSSVETTITAKLDPNPKK